MCPKVCPKPPLPCKYLSLTNNWLTIYMTDDITSALEEMAEHVEQPRTISRRVMGPSPHELFDRGQGDSPINWNYPFSDVFGDQPEGHTQIIEGEASSDLGEEFPFGDSVGEPGGESNLLQEGEALARVWNSNEARCPHGHYQRYCSHCIRIFYEGFMGGSRRDYGEVFDWDVEGLSAIEPQSDDIQSEISS